MEGGGMGHVEYDHWHGSPGACRIVLGGCDCVEERLENGKYASATRRNGVGFA